MEDIATPFWYFWCLDFSALVNPKYAAHAFFIVRRKGHLFTWKRSSRDAAAVRGSESTGGTQWQQIRDQEVNQPAASYPTVWRVKLNG